MLLTEPRLTNFRLFSWKECSWHGSQRKDTKESTSTSEFVQEESRAQEKGFYPYTDHYPRGG